jgi:hypothetical protein
MTVYFTDGEKIGKMNIDLQFGEYPTKEKCLEWVEKSKPTADEMGLKLCSPHEFGREVILEKTGQHLAIPGPDVWEEESFNVKEEGQIGNT